MTYYDTPTAPIFDFYKKPVINLSVLCVPVPPAPERLCIKLPFGTELCPTSSRVNVGVLEYTTHALEVVSTALAPMMPFFRIMDAILSIAKTLTVIKDVIGPPPNFKPLLDALSELVPKIVYLAKSMPIFTLPLMVVSVLDMFIDLVEGAAIEFTTLARHIKRIQTAQINVAQAPGLAVLIGCAQTSVETQMDNVEHLLAVVNPVIDIINIIAAAFGVQGDFPLPKFEGIAPVDALATAALLTELATKLHVIRNAIPL